jgi:hypothetical protein
MKSLFKILFLIFLFISCNFTMSQTDSSKNKIVLDKRFTIKLGETFTLNPDFKLKFVGNSHKTMLPDGPESPLIIYVDYTYKGKDYQMQYNRYDALPYVWRWNEYLMVVTENKYNEMMEVKISMDNYSEDEK